MKLPSFKWFVISLIGLAILGCSGDDDLRFEEEEGEEGEISTPLVKGLDITEVAVYQALKIGLMKDGTQITDRPVPVISGKDALLRIYVERQDEWKKRPIVARIDFEVPEGEDGPEPIEIEIEVSFDSVEEDINSTLNIDIPGDTFVSGLRYFISLLEVDETVEDAKGSDKNARWPSEETKPLKSGSPGDPPLEIVIIPIRYNADGSGRLPDTSKEQLTAIRNAFYAQYPVSKVKLIVDEPLDWNQKISGMGIVGWNTLLNKITKERNERGAARNQYYYGLFAAAESFAKFCNLGCISGLSALAMNPTDDFARASIGIGFAGSESVGTMVHEVGHAHGREHAPCGLGPGNPSDKNYPKDDPHNAAAIGYTGFDIRNNLWKADTAKDFMSYCKPTWVSDYTYNALFERVKAVNQLAYFIPPVAFNPQWLSLSIDPLGGLSAGPTLKLWTTPGGYPQPIEWLDENENSLGEGTAYFHPYSHLGGGRLLFPTPPKDIVYVRLSDGQTFDLSRL
jgi:hypothetical protein